MAFICSYSALIYSQVTHELSTREKFGPTKYPREKILDPPRNDGTMTRDPGSLTHFLF